MILFLITAFQVIVRLKQPHFFIRSLHKISLHVPESIFINHRIKNPTSQTIRSSFRIMLKSDFMISTRQSSHTHLLLTSTLGLRRYRSRRREQQQPRLHRARPPSIWLQDVGVTRCYKTQLDTKLHKSKNEYLEP